MGINVRQKAPAKKDGSQRLFLDIFFDGKRWSEMLDVKVYPAMTKEETRRVMADAESIKANRWAELLREKKGRDSFQLGKVRFIDYYKLVADTKSEATREVWYNSLPAIEAYMGDMSIKDVDENWLKSFQGHLATWKSKNSKQPLQHNTQQNYYAHVATALTHAYKNDIIPTNPVEKVAKLSPVYKARVYLTIEEITRLEKTPLEGRDMKQAAMFNLYMGLRIGDLKSLCWRSIVHRAGEYYLEFEADKDDDMKYIPIPDPAIEWLPPRAEEDDAKVFHLYGKDQVNRLLRQWAKDAGVNKDLTSHILRHTMAVQGLDAGLDLMDIKEKLGHKTLKMTIHYARVSNQKMRNAAKKFPRLATNRKK